MPLSALAVDLTATEYELLRALSLDAGRVVTFETLLRRVWAKRGNADANLVRIFVRNLRRKLGDSAAEPVYLFNDRGVGYRMAQPLERCRVGCVVISFGAVSGSIAAQRVPVGVAGDAPNAMLRVVSVPR